MNKPKFVLNLEKSMFDICYSLKDQEELQSIVELVGGMPGKTEYTRKWLFQNIKEAKACITGWGSIPFDEEIFDEARKLKILFHTAGSVSSYYDKAVGKNIRVVSNASVNAIPVAEFALGIILSGLKGIYHYQERFRSKGKAVWKRDISVSPGYYGTIVGIIGLGYVGYKLVKLLQQFDFNVLVYSGHLDEGKDCRLNVRKVSLDELMSQSDVVILCTSNLPENRRMIDTRRLALMKDNALFVNIARGTLVNEDALVKELKRGRITAFLDVTDPEPPEKGHPFYTLSNCILTPHIAGSFGAECHRLGKTTLSEIKRYLKGEPLKNELYPDEFLYRA